MKTYTYMFAKRAGAKYVLTTEKGEIKAVGNTESLLLFSSRKAEGDMVMPVERYRRLWPHNW